MTLPEHPQQGTGSPPLPRSAGAEGPHGTGKAETGAARDEVDHAPATGTTPAPALLRVAVPAPLRRYFDYLPPDPRSGPAPAVGCRVRVPFGRSRTAIGVVVALPASAEVPASRLRAATETLDDAPLLPADLVQLIAWAADYYHHAPGEAFATALPGALRKGRQPAPKAPERWGLSAGGRAQDPAALTRRAPRQAAVLRALSGAPPTGLGADALEWAAGPDWRGVLRRMVEAGLVAPLAAEDPAPGTSLPPAPGAGAAATRDDADAVRLTPHQQAAVTRIERHLAARAFAVCLLHGVTGSGKTEVYLRALRRVLADGGQALVLVPEIGLTPQLVARLAGRLPAPIVTLHSGMSDTARARAFLDARAGRAGVVLGTRSGVFAPFRDLRLIVVDEEHDASLKQQDGFRYHARDLAVYRGRQLGIPVVLGSATPSLESLNNAQQDRYELLRLPERAGAGAPPRVQLVDLRRDRPRGGLSGALIDRMRTHLEAGAQVLLFLNRRGFAPVWMCGDCGWIATCPRCDAKLTYHDRRQRLRCHHCGHERAAGSACADCAGTPGPVGEGTEQVEQALTTSFPEHRVARIDRDSTRRRGELERQLEDIRRGDTRILVGTQMLTKGHDFPGVTLVGVINADGGLFSSDFRAPERLAQLIVQVAGRAGRASRGGEVLVQTAFPDHPLLYTLLREGYEGFSRVAARERESAGWPPFSALALLRAEAPEARTSRAFLETAHAIAQETLAGTADARDVLLLGPAPAPMERRAGRYRAQLLLQAPARAPLQRLLAKLLPRLDDLPQARRVRWSVDVDPIDLD